MNPIRQPFGQQGASIAAMTGFETRGLGRGVVRPVRGLVERLQVWLRDVPSEPAVWARVRQQWECVEVIAPYL